MRRAPRGWSWSSTAACDRSRLLAGLRGYRIGLTLALPLFGKRGAAEGAAAARHRAALRERDQALAGVDGSPVATYRRYQAARELARELEEEVLPTQRGAAELARSAHTEGQGGLVAVLEADRSLADAEAEWVDARVDAAVIWAELEWAATSLGVVRASIQPPPPGVQLKLGLAGRIAIQLPGRERSVLVPAVAVRRSTEGTEEVVLCAAGDAADHFMPQGTSLEETDRIASHLDHILETTPGVVQKRRDHRVRGGVERPVRGRPGNCCAF